MKNRFLVVFCFENCILFTAITQSVFVKNMKKTAMQKKQEKLETLTDNLQKNLAFFKELLPSEDILNYPYVKIGCIGVIFLLPNSHLLFLLWRLFRGK